MGKLAVIHMKTHGNLLPFDNLVGNTPIIWVELEALLDQTLDKLLVV